MSPQETFQLPRLHAAALPMTAVPSPVSEKSQSATRAATPDTAEFSCRNKGLRAATRLSRRRNSASPTRVPQPPCTGPMGLSLMPLRRCL